MTHKQTSLHANYILTIKPEMLQVIQNYESHFANLYTYVLFWPYI